MRTVNEETTTVWSTAKKDRLIIEQDNRRWRCCAHWSSICCWAWRRQVKGEMYLFMRRNLVLWTQSRMRNTWSVSTVEHCFIGSGPNVTKPAVAITCHPSQSCQDLQSGCLEPLLKVTGKFIRMLTRALVWIASVFCWWLHSTKLSM